MKQNKIGIVGYGFVGSAIASSFDGLLDGLVIMDKAKGHNATYLELIECDGIFVCVPTPQDENGTCDTSILSEILLNINSYGYKGVIISKCTAPPDVYTELNKLYPNLVHVPEFLTAANARIDYISGKFAFIGGSVFAYQREAERIIKSGYNSIEKIQYCTIAEAALAKYAINTFMATKVTFMNELYNLATASKIDYNAVVNMIGFDPRIGASHMKVPGPEGEFGFGGACFPKDTSALLKYAEKYNVEMDVLGAAVAKNAKLRLL
jgi:UDPglucose 6-dehydrogenase